MTMNPTISHQLAQQIFTFLGSLGWSTAVFFTKLGVKNARNSLSAVVIMSENLSDIK